jgi:hypothetical protein
MNYLFIHLPRGLVPCVVLCGVGVLLGMFCVSHVP